MNRAILLIILAFISSSLYADSSNRFKAFVDTYFEAVRSNNKESLQRLSVSKGMCQHDKVKQVLNKVADNPYQLEIAPFSKDSKDYKFALALSGGEPVFQGKPSHTLKITWSYSKEAFSPGHKCHSLRMTTAKIWLAVSDNKKMLEHTYCKDEKKATNTAIVLLTDLQKNNVKEYILKQKRFSRLKTIQYLHNEFGVSNDQADKITTEICGEI